MLENILKQKERMADFEDYNEEVKIIPWKIISEFKGKELEGLRI